MRVRLKVGYQLHVACAVLFLAAGCYQKTPSSTPGSDTLTAQQPEFDPDHRIRFTDVAESSGVHWTAHNGEEANFYTILESFGSGCAVDDFDLDGKLDLWIGGGGKFGPGREILPLPISLYRQVANWSFIPVTIHAGLEPIKHYHHGIWTVDADEDGFSDLLITGWGGLQFFRNQGDGTFVDRTSISGLHDPLWSLAAGWGDFNNDHVLDLFVGHYVDWSFDNDPVCIDKRMGTRNVCDPTVFRGLPCSVFLGNGDGTYREGGTETNVTGIGKTLGVVIADLNDDNRADIYVANDTVPNQLYASMPSGKYREMGLEHGVALGETGASDGSMGVDLGDLTGDGEPDLWVANYENQTFALYRNLGGELFTHASRAYGVTAVGSEAVGFGTVILDADGDGRPDIFCANGHIWAPNSTLERRQRPYLFRNEDWKRYRNVADSAGEYFRKLHLGRGTACGDLDANGTPDLLITHTNEPVALLRNDAPISDWLSVRLIGRSSPRSAIGAKLTIVVDGKIQTAFVKGGGSYLSTSDRTVLFGLGNTPMVDEVKVEWPTGQASRLVKVRSCQQLILIEPQ